jgi:hypothetical protein
LPFSEKSAPKKKNGVGNAISDFESLIYELKIGEEKLLEATKIIEEYINGRD